MADNFLERQYAAYLEHKSGAAKKKHSVSVFHLFHTDISGIELPTRFTNPFDYQPHPLCQLAASEVQSYITLQTSWHQELSNGKMFGVLVVKRIDGKIGFLSAFSGTLQGQMALPYFVPPIYDQTQPKGYFRQEESIISRLRHQYLDLLHSEPYLQAKNQLEQMTSERNESISLLKETYKKSKERRHQLREAQHLTAEEEQDLIRESQFQKAEIKRQEQQWAKKLQPYQQAFEFLNTQAVQFQKDYNNRSIELQQWLFQQYQLLNASGNSTPLLQVHPSAPSGTGDCAAPKLLQYAFQHQMRPLCMAEFWWGNGNHEHGHYYPSCKSKCQPLLQYMLQGLELEEPYSTVRSKELSTYKTLEVLYEDDYLIAINKPSGMLSVPGHAPIVNVADCLKLQYPEKDFFSVHRLDMDTSGILLLAKDSKTSTLMQQAFEQRKVHKQYVAILEAMPQNSFGTISLPLAPNYEEHPLQQVDFEHGHQAITNYQVIGQRGEQARIIFEPLTGRTHQLRIHAAHRLGLHCPILGDTLYGKTAERLFLHAFQLSFTHPHTGQSVTIQCREPF